MMEENDIHMHMLESVLELLRPRRRNQTLLNAGTDATPIS